jgi:Transcription factor zinc-finger
MTTETQTTEAQGGAMACPKDGTPMAPLGRRGRGGTYRCPECSGMFIDVETMRRGRAGKPPMWAPFAMSVLMSVGMTLLVRRLRRRPKA